MSENKKEFKSSTYIVRDQKVALDFEVARLYGVSLAYLHRQVKKHAYRFPIDFMFVLLGHEVVDLRTRSGVLNLFLSHPQQQRMVFTSLGVSELSFVLNTPQAIETSVAIVREFVGFRGVLDSDTESAKRARLPQDAALIFALIDELMVR